MTTYRLDGSVRRVTPVTLLGGSPLRLFRLTEAGAAMIDRVTDGEPVSVNTLVERLVDAGVIHPQSSGIGPFSTDDVTIVVPAYAPAGTTLHIPALGARVVVVDDASPGMVVAPAGATVIRRPTNGGPSAARATGLEHVTTALVAFVDTDVSVAAGWLDDLIRHFADESVVAVAPRVRCDVGDSLIARYESSRSPLDLGPDPARVRARTRVSYVPTAALVARTKAISDIGGFDPILRTGEDVDLVWRLDERGGRVRYEPSVVVAHAPRRTLLEFVKQRRGYGRSAAPLAQRHAGALAPVGVSGWSAGVWAAVVFGQPVGAAAVAVGTGVALIRKLPQLPPREAARLVALGHLGAGRQVAAAITRVWWPMLLPLALVSRRVRRVLLAAWLIPAASDWKRSGTRLDPIRYTGLRLLDDMSYGVGVWEGALRERTIDPLVPDLTSWPAAGRYDRGRTKPDG
jgi:mycofactocin glycosyltransferase